MTSSRDGMIKHPLFFGFCGEGVGIEGCIDDRAVSSLSQVDCHWMHGTGVSVSHRSWNVS